MARTCKEHEFGEPVGVGGGIVRLMCSRCGAVHLDLARQDVLVNSGLFQSGRIKWMTWEPDMKPIVQYERSFGKAPERRRRLQPAVA